MKTILLFAVYLCSLASFNTAFASSTPEDPSTAWPEVIETSAPTNTNQSVDDSKKVKDTVATIKSYPVENRDEAVGKARAALDDFDKRMIKLEARAKAGTQQAINRLREQRAEAGKQLETMKTTSRELWEKAKDAFVESYRALEQKFQKTDKDQ